MADMLYRGGRGSGKLRSKRVEYPGRRPKCRCYKQGARKFDAAASQATDGLRRPAAKMNADFLRGVSHV